MFFEGIYGFEEGTEDCPTGRWTGGLKGMGMICTE